METADILLIAGAVVLALFAGLLYVVLKATTRIADNAREIMLALEDIAAKAQVLEQLDGAASSTHRATSQLPDSAPTGNGSGKSAGEGTEVPS